jgi:hypothetical protein
MSRWNTARWGSDRWPALTVAELLQQPPAADRGVLIGLGDWRLVVEILLPNDSTSTWGTATWGSSQWGVFAWQDITGYVRGADWTRGQDQPYGRPRVGSLTVTLESPGDVFNPWTSVAPFFAPAYWAPGTLIRIGLRSATETRSRGWLPQITAIVDVWKPKRVGNNADRFVTVTANETLRDLAQIDQAAGPATGVQTASARITELLARSGWKYGLLIEAQNVLAAGGQNMQSSVTAGNRLAECYLVADSADAVFRSDRTGAALLTQPEYIGTVGDADPILLPLSAYSNRTPNFTPLIAFDWRNWTAVSGTSYACAYLPDTFESGNTDDSVMNDCRLTRVGGSQQVSRREASVSRFGVRNLTRNDLLNTNDTEILQRAQYLTSRRALNSLRVESLELRPLTLPTPQALAVFAADHYSQSNVWEPDERTDAGRGVILAFLATMRHTFTSAGPNRVHWVTTFGFDTRIVFNLPAAQLPPT